MNLESKDYRFISINEEGSKTTLNLTSGYGVVDDEGIPLSLDGASSVDQFKFPTTEIEQIRMKIEDLIKNGAAFSSYDHYKYFEQQPA